LLKEKNFTIIINTIIIVIHAEIKVTLWGTLQHKYQLMWYWRDPLVMGPV